MQAREERAWRLWFSMTKFAYLLHQFPRTTDTFIRRELRSLERLGKSVHVVSVWWPRDVPKDLIEEWSHQTTYLLPASILSVIATVGYFAAMSPRRFFSAAMLALRSAQPGGRGLIFQAIYFIQAVLAATVIKRLDINHLHNHFGDHSGTVTMLAAALTGIDYSISFHGPHVFLLGWQANIKAKVGSSKFIRCIGYFCQSQVLLYSEGLHREKIHIVHCGLDMSQFQYQQPRNELKILFCSARLAPEKGIDYLIRALADPRMKGLQLRLAGDGPSRAELQREVTDLGLSDSVVFLGNVSTTGVIDELKSADLFVLPSLAEGIPVSLMEAMAIGVPVIATNVAGVSELVDDGKTGLLVCPTDSEGLVSAIEMMMNDFDLRSRISNAGRVKVIDEFDIDKETKKLNKLFG